MHGTSGERQLTPPDPSGLPLDDVFDPPSGVLANAMRRVTAAEAAGGEPLSCYESGTQLLVSAAPDVSLP
ncbi:FxSxx-COOH cyclophane-containing RiPP peptide [Streptomyces sp. NPDC058045]|uniref:FxSxx-COOH cyclophane-containing RiPP peptide n=1 Tax=Streptomyces sp. NPDC058045 TaxID=3346311 RepID=UPI0036E21F7C